MIKKLLISTLFVLFSANAFASDCPERKIDRSEMKELFTNSDANKDGSLDKAEFAKFHEEREKMRKEEKKSSDQIFAEIDANKDGKASKDEMKAHKKAKHEQMKACAEEKAANKADKK